MPHKPRTFLTDEQIQNAATFYRAGLSLGALGRALGCSSETIRRKLHAAGVPMRRQPVRLTAWGETKSAAEWADDDRCPVTEDALRQRVAAGWDVQRAVERPPHARRT